MVVEGNFDHFGSITLEICNQGPFKIILHAGMQIGMLVFVKLTEPVGKKQSFNYRKQIGVLPPDLKALKQ
jgi:deoxycytidine triphosphate deaminase